MAEKSVHDEIQDVLNKMARAHQRGNGCRLTAREMEVLYVTQIGAWWGQPDPREAGAAQSAAAVQLDAKEGQP